MKEGSGQLVDAFRSYLERVPFLKIVSWKKEARVGEFTAGIVFKLSLPAGEQVIIRKSSVRRGRPPIPPTGFGAELTEIDRIRQFQAHPKTARDHATERGRDVDGR